MNTPRDKHKHTQPHTPMAIGNSSNSNIENDNYLIGISPIVRETWEF